MSFLDNYTDHLVFLISAGMLFLPLEHLLPRVKRTRFLREHTRLDVTYMLFGVLMIIAISTLYVAIVVKALEPIVSENLRSAVREQPLWVKSILLIIFADLYYYWAHRLFHKIPVLWKFHSIHHSIEHMDWIAAYRTHPFDTAITNSGAIILAISFDFGIAALLVYSAQFSWHSLLKHSNIKVGWKRLRWLYLTPTFHHWHHANVVEAYDKNFSGQLPIWDIVFGTANLEEETSPPVYGCDDPVPRTFGGSLAYPFTKRKERFEVSNDTPINN